MRKIIRQSYKTMMITALTFILAFGTLLHTPASYAAETDVPSTTIETGTPETPTVPLAPENSAEPNLPGNTAEPSDPTEANPLAPQNLRFVEDSITVTSATIEWDLNLDPEVNDIHVWLADTNKYYSWGNSGSRTFNDLSPETKYRLFITWLKDGESIVNKSNIIEFTTLAGETNPEPPNNIGPRNLEVVEVTHNTVSLKWDPAPGINAYWIWDANDKYIFWANDGAQKVGGLEPETTYSFYVGPDGIQAPNLKPEQKSNIVTFTTLADTSEYPDPPLTAPSYLKVMDLTADSVTLNWGASPKATGYDIYVNGDWKGGTWSNSATSYKYEPVGGLVAGQKYSFEIGAQNPPSPVSVNSNKVTITWGELEAPKDVQVITATRTNASLGWAPSPGATSYDIYQGNVLIGSSDSNRYVATGLTEGQSYSYKVVAKNRLWESAQSDGLTVIPGSNYNIVTYYMSWAVSENGRNYKPTDIDVSQVTHINYAFSDLCWKGFGTGATACQNDNIPLQKNYVFDGEMVIGDPEVDQDNFKAFESIKEQNPQLKLMISVGGWSWSKNFSNMAATEETRRAFANSVVKFLRAYQLEGLDIDWEYPVEGGEAANSRGPEDKENFTLLTRTVREALDAAGSEDGKYYLQTIAGAQGDNFVINADLANSSNYLDFANIMAYDYSGSWEKLAHHNAPLFFDKNHPSSTAPRNNVQGAILSYLTAVPNYKVVVGVPFYGKGWYGCPEGGEYQTCADGTPFGSWESGLFDYTDIEKNYINTNGYVRYWNDASKVAYVYNPDEKVFITYNDQTTMMYTASLLKSLDIAGVMSWEITGDRNKTLTTELAQDLPIHNNLNPAALAAPHNLKATTKSQTSIQVKWDAVAEATEYEIFLNKQSVGYTTATQFTLDSLTVSTNYTIHVLAIVKDADVVQKVSVRSNEINVTTLSDTVTPPVTPDNPGSSSGGGGTYSGGATQTATIAKDQLPVQISKNGDKLIARIQANTALTKINQSDLTTFRIVIKDKAKQVEVIVPKEVIAAITKKGDQALLIIVVNDVEYAIPVHSLNSLTDIKITIKSPSQDGEDQMAKAIQAKGLKLLHSPLEFIVEQLKADQTSAQINNFGNHFLSRKFTLSAKDIDVNKATGVIYSPDTGEIRSVPTLFKVNTDGTITAELKRQGNSIYAIVATSFSFQDAIPDWAKKDVSLAATKLIVDEESPNQYGASSNITRAEITSMIVKALGVMPDKTPATFTDVSPESKYASDITAAKRAGLISGKSEDIFSPNDHVTRQELAVMLANVMKYAGVTKEANLAVLNQFRDQPAISAYAKTSLALMVENKILQGVSPTELDPQSNVTKAQAAVVVMRLLRALQLSN